MAYTILDNPTDTEGGNTGLAAVLDAQGADKLDLPDKLYVSDSDISRDGMDLVLGTSEGTLVVKGYFAEGTPPVLYGPDGSALTPALVESFMHGGAQYAQAEQTQNDESPIGIVQELSGSATITHPDGTIEIAVVGMPIYQGDVIETDEEGALNILFIDETTFAVSEDARLAIDEYVFDPATQSGTTHFSVLKGMFVFTSGLVGREDPDDVMINTPAGSIGIRGTIIAGNVDTAEITVIEGAIVLYDLSGNTMTLSTQYETARFNVFDGGISNVGTLSADEMASKFVSISGVAGDLFSSVQDTANESQENGQKRTVSDEEGEESSNAQGEEADDSTESSGDDSASLQMETQVVTSDDIIGDSLQETEEIADSSGEATAEATTAEASSTQEAGSEDVSYELVVNDIQEPPPFSLSITRLPVSENVSGQAVARVMGEFTNFTTLTVLGASANYYDAIRESDNSFLIRLKSGIALDAERPFKLLVGAQNEYGAGNISEEIALDVLNVNEPIILTNHAPNISLSAKNFFTGSENSKLVYDIAHEFFDPEGQIVSYAFDGSVSHADLAYANITGSTLTLLLDNNLVGNDSFSFSVKAMAADGTFAIQTFTYNMSKSSIGTGVNFITGTNAVYSGNDPSITINGTNVKVFTDMDVSNNTVEVNALSAYVKTGDGDDTIKLNTDQYAAYGDRGHDVFEFATVKGFAYGGEDGDLFLVNASAVLGNTGQLETSASGVVLIDGGSGHDVLKFSTGGSLNFSNVDDGFIKNMEVLSFDNGSANNVVLNYSDVLAMTDGKNVLTINLDTNDHLTFSNAGHTFVQDGGFTSQEGENYALYTDGNITLLVDSEAASVSGIL